MPFLILCTRLFFDEYLKIVRVFSLLCSAPFSVLAFFSLSFSFDFYVQDLPFCLPILCFYSLVLCACILLYLLQSPLSFSWYPLFFSLPFPSIFFAFLPFSPVFFFFYFVPFPSPFFIFYPSLLSLCAFPRLALLFGHGRICGLHVPRGARGPVDPTVIRPPPPPSLSRALFFCPYARPLPITDAVFCPLVCP